MKNFKKGSGVYKCQSCGKSTRETGHSESGSRCCVDCYELAGCDNFLSDNGAEELRNEYGSRILVIFNARPELIEKFLKLREALAI